MTIPVDKPIICPVLVGRDQELAALRHLLKHTSSGQGQVLLLCGEAGIGKSRLVAELKTSATAQGFRVLEGKCFPTDLTCPYAPLRDLLRSCFASLSPASIVAAVGPFARALSPLLPERVSIGDLTLDTRGRHAWIRDRKVTLTGKEYALLEYLARRAGDVVGGPPL